MCGSYYVVVGSTNVLLFLLQSVLDQQIRPQDQDEGGGQLISICGGPAGAVYGVSRSGWMESGLLKTLPS